MHLNWTFGIGIGIDIDIDMDIDFDFGLCCCRSVADLGEVLESVANTEASAFRALPISFGSTSTPTIDAQPNCFATAIVKKPSLHL